MRQAAAPGDVTRWMTQARHGLARAEQTDTPWYVRNAFRQQIKALELQLREIMCMDRPK